MSIPTDPIRPRPPRVAPPPVTVYGEEATGSADKPLTFASQDDFRTWAKTSAIAAHVEQFFDELPKVQAYEAREKEFQSIQELGLRRGAENYAALAELLGVDVKDEEVVRVSMIDKTPLTPRIFDPVLLYDRRIEVEPPTGAPVDPRTAMLPVFPGWWPVLGWFGWDNRARSARIFGINVACTNNWWGGSWLWLIGFNGLLNLDRVGFDRSISSMKTF